MRFKITILLALFSCMTAISQDMEGIDLEAFTDRMFSVQTTDINYEDLYEQFLQWYLNPLDLNEANEEELRSLYILTNDQIRAFLDYRNSYGPILSFYELQVIPEMDKETLWLLQPFVKVKEAPIRYDMNKSFLMTRIDGTLEEKQGYQNGRYLGSPYRLYTRLKVYTDEDINFGITVEKDAGEQLRWNPGARQYLMDYNSFHLQVRNRGWLRNVVIGDYQAQFGQGLVLGSGFFLGKGTATVSTVRKSNLGVRPYTSLLETGFMRGIALTAGSEKLQATVLASYRRTDGTIESDSASTDVSWIRSIQNTGYHRTESELLRKGAISQLSYGGNITYSPTRGMTFGLTGVLTSFQDPVQPVNRNYNQFYFSGKSNLITGAFLNYTWRNFTFFSEAARSSSGGNGIVAGAIMSLSATLDLSFLLRNYDRDFHSLHGSAFGEGNGLINEKGTYVGIAFRPTNGLSINGYYDKFSFPWLRYRTFSISDGREILLRSTYQFSKTRSVFVQFREERKPRDRNSPDPVRKVDAGMKRNFVFNADYEIVPGFDLRSRIQYSHFRFDNAFTEGITLIQDLNIVLLEQLTISGRFAVFDTDDYENRQYSYEKDVLYSFSLPAYYGRGVRTMLMIRYRPVRSIDLWFKYGRSRYRDREEVGSGLERISGSRKTDLRFQMRVRF